MEQLEIFFTTSAQKPPLQGLWPAICSFDNLLWAYKKARRGKRHRDVVALFELEREDNLCALQQEMRDLSYQPGPYRQFTIYDKKARVISAAPFRDRVLQHALMNVLEPLLDSEFIPHCYACRKGKGVHAAVDQYQHWAQRYAYVLKLDVKHYFPSVDHHVLLTQLRAAIADTELLAVVARILASYPSTEAGKGMAIGNLTSQFFGNFYLRELDRFINDTLGLPYLRYVDDLVLLSDSKPVLWEAKRAIEQQLVALQLCLHTNKAQIFRSTDKVPMFGYQISRYKRWLQAANGHAARRRLKSQLQAVKVGVLPCAAFRSSLQAWIGHAQHGETWGLREVVFQAIS
jgi:RNA-directed DNA polymerase